MLLLFAFALLVGMIAALTFVSNDFAVKAVLTICSALYVALPLGVFVAPELQQLALDHRAVAEPIVGYVQPIITALIG